MKKLLIIILAQLFTLPLTGQTSIKGKVVDLMTKEAIDLADIALFRSADNSFAEVLYTDESGNFTIELPGQPAQFYLEVGALGYHPQTVTLEHPDSLTIQLEEDMSYELARVTIMAKKKAVSIQGDKIIYDIEQMGIGTANNGLETIRQLPGISLDKDENIRFRGSTGIQIMINGKKSMLQGDALREFVRSLNGDDIRYVEIISQPSARYEATGTTGILNIVLKRNITRAIGGNVYTYGSYGAYFKHQTGGGFFYNDDTWSVNAGGSYYNGKSFNNRSVDQVIQSGNDRRNLYQDNYWLPETERKSFNLGIERKLNKRQLISTEWQWYTEKENVETSGKTFDDLNGTLQNEVDLIQKSKAPADQISGNLFYNFMSDSLTTKIDVQLNYGHYKKSIIGFQQNQYTSGAMDRLDGWNQTRYNLMNAQIDWNQALFKQLHLESGAKLSYADMNYFNRYDAVQGSNLMIPDSLMIHDFLYKEKLTSAYSQLDYKLRRWSFLAGLRIENYKSEAATHTDSYTHWFPSASVNYGNDHHQYRLSYSKRISRPGYLTLNPYFQYLDAYTVEQGNPDLKPQFYHSFELNYIYKNSLSFGLYGYLYKDGFVSVIHYQNNGNYNILYPSNASSGSRWGLSASIPYEVGNWWTMQYGLDAYLQSEKSEIPDYEYEGTGYGYELNMYHRFTLPDSWIITWNGFLTGKNQTPTGYSPMIYDFSTSVQKSLMNDKLRLAAGCTNILKKSMWNHISTVDNVTTHWINKWETRKFYLQLTYRLGGHKEKKVKNTSLSEEQNRM